jgi:hypothetical protein
MSVIVLSLAKTSERLSYLVHRGYGRRPKPDERSREVSIRAILF